MAERLKSLDIRCLYDTLKRLCRTAGISHVLKNLSGCKIGEPESCVRLLRILLFTTVVEVADELLARTCTSYCSDKKMLLCTFDLLREVVKVNPIITAEQFLSVVN
jgi:hypothetical protein